MHDKRRYDLSRLDGESTEEHIERLLEIVQRIEWQSEGHRQWYTHKNPYGCWICELLQIVRQVLDERLAEIRGREANSGTADKDK